MTAQKRTFRNRNGVDLSARLDLPADGEPAACALFAHCFTCGKDLKAAHNVSRALARENIAVLRFDFTGLGESQGDFADTSFTSNVEDLVDAAAYLEKTFRAPDILIGHSLGGAAVLQAASRIPSAKAVAVIAAPSDPGHVTRHLGDAADTVREKGEGTVTIAGRTFTLRRRFLEDLEATRMEETVADLRRALLVFHAPLDEVVAVDNAARIFRWARHPKSFVSLDTADHLLSDARDSRYVGEMIAAWARRYVGGAGGAAGPKPSPDGPVTVRIGGSGFAVDIRAAGHGLTADEPVGAVGGGLGPSPYDLLAAALGACTAMTLRMYADRKGWALEAATVRLRHRKVHAEDCRDCEAGGGAIDRIDREIVLEGPLSADQHRRLMEIADRCPVHRTLLGEIRIETRRIEGEDSGGDR